MLARRWPRASGEIGIDVGTRQVRMLQLARRGSGWAVAAAACEPLPTELSGYGEAFHREVAVAIRRMLGRGRFRGRRVISALPSGMVRSKSVRLPAMPADELAAAVRWEASDRLRLGADEAMIQHIDAGEVRQGDELRRELIVMGAPTRLIEQHVAALTACGLEPVAVDVIPAALARAAAMREAPTGTAPDDTAPAVILDVGHATSKVVIAHGGRVIFFKQIDVGGRDLERAGAESLGMAVEEARRRGPVATQGPDGSALGEPDEAVTAQLTEVGRELGLCLRYYSVTFRGRRPDRVALVGGRVFDPGSVARLSEASGATVFVVDPFEGLDVPASLRLPSEAGERGAWAVALGLAARGRGPASVRRDASRRDGRKEAA